MKGKNLQKPTNANRIILIVPKNCISFTILSGKLTFSPTIFYCNLVNLYKKNYKKDAVSFRSKQPESAWLQGLAINWRFPGLATENIWLKLILNYRARKITPSVTTSNPRLMLLLCIGVRVAQAAQGPWEQIIKRQNFILF